MADGIQVVLSVVDKATKPIKALDRALVGLLKPFRALKRNATDLNQSLELLGKTSRALSAPFKAIVREGAAFESQMSRIKSISKITEKDFQALTKEAKRIGETTVFTATQAAQGMEELSRAGFDAAQNIAIAGDAMDLAAAQGSELADTARLVGIGFKLFSDQGLTAQDIVDDFNKSIGSSAQNMEDFTEAFKFAAGQASAFNQPLSEVTKTIALLADVGFKGTLAGTAFRAGITRLAKPTKEAQKVLADLNLTMEDINPETTKFTDVLVKLRNAGISNTQVLTLFGQIAGGKFIKVIQDINTLLPEYEQKLNNAKTAQQSAADQLDNLTGDFTLFQSALSGLQIAIFDELNESLRESTQEATNFVKGITQFVKDNKELIGSIIQDLFAFGEVIGMVVVGSIRGLGNLLIAFGTVHKFFQDVGAGIGIVIGDIITDFVLIGTEVDAFIVKAMRAFDDFDKTLMELDDAVSEFVGDVIDGIAGLVNDAIAAFQRLWEFVKDIPANIAKAFAGFGDKIAKEFDALIDVIPGARTALNVISGAFDDTTESADGLSFALTGNSVVPDLEATGKVSIEAGRKLKTLSDNFDETTKSADKTDNTLISAGEALLKVANTLEDGFDAAKKFNGEIENTTKTIKEAQETAEKGIVVQTRMQRKGKELDLAGIGNVELTDVFSTDAIRGIGEDFGKSVAQSIPGVSGAISGLQAAGGNPLGAVAGFFGELLMKTEGFQEAMKIIGDALIELMEPLGQVLIPIAKFLARIIRKIAPFVEKIARVLGRMFEALLPIIESVLEVLMPILEILLDFIVLIFELLQPVMEALKPVLDLIVPILNDLKPVLKIIGEVLTQLMPFIKLALQPLLVQLKLVLGAINLVVQIINIIFAAWKQWTGFLRGIANVINGFVRGIANAIKVVEDFIKKIFDVVNEILSIIPGIGGGPGGGGFGIGIPGLGGIGISGEGISINTPIGGVDIGFANGTNQLTRSQLLRLPGMEAGAGLVKAHVGEQIIPANQSGESGNTFIFNIKSIDPMNQKEEIRQVIESLWLERRLKVS